MGSIQDIKDHVAALWAQEPSLKNDYEALRTLLEENQTISPEILDALHGYRRQLGAASYSHTWNLAVISYVMSLIATDEQRFELADLNLRPILGPITVTASAPSGAQTLSGLALTLSSLPTPSTSAAPPAGDLPSWASGLSLTAEQETALLLSPTNTGCRIAEGSLTPHPGNNIDISSLAGTNGYPVGVVGGYLFQSDTDLLSGSVRVVDCVFKGGVAGGASYPHDTRAGEGWQAKAPWQYEYCTFDGLASTGTKACLNTAGPGKSCSYYRCKFQGGTDNFHMNGGATANFVECYFWGAYNSPGAHSDVFQIYAPVNMSIGRMYSCKTIGPFHHPNGMNLNASPTSFISYDSYHFGGNRIAHMSSGMTQWIRSMICLTSLGHTGFYGPTIGGSVCWLNPPAIAEKCIEVPWTDVPGIQGFIDSSSNPSMPYWNENDLPAFQYINGLGWGIPASYPPATPP